MSTTFERIDLSDYAYLRDRWPGNRLLAIIDDAYAEIDRLRANAIEWTIVTDDPATRPEQDSDVLVDTVRWYNGEPSEMRTYYVLHLEFDSIENLSPGDRWAYIPKPEEVK